MINILLKLFYFKFIIKKLPNSFDYKFNIIILNKSRKIYFFINFKNFFKKLLTNKILYDIIQLMTYIIN